MTENTTQKIEQDKTHLKRRKVKKAGTSQFCMGVRNMVLKFQIENRKIERCIAVYTWYLVLFSRYS